MYGISTMRILLIFAVFVVISGANGDGPDLSDIQRAFEKSQPGYMVCYYYGSTCKRDSQVCNPDARTCTDINLFAKDATDLQKCEACRNFIAKYNAANDTPIDDEHHGYFDACVYIIGNMVAHNKSVCCGLEQTLKRKVGHELCPFGNSKGDDMSQCRLGEEYCTLDGCQPLFKMDASSEVKIKYCEEVLKSNDTLKVDPCIYALGLLLSIKSNQTNSPTDGSADSKNRTRCSDTPASETEKGLTIATSVLATVVVVLVAIIAALVGLIVCWRKKIACFKKEDGTRSKARTPNPRADGNDENRERIPMMENAENSLIENITTRDARNGPEGGDQADTAIDLD